MRTRVATIVLVVGIIFSGMLLVSRLGRANLPNSQQGYEPEQPIAFSHRLHAGELQIACVYCHSGADKSRHAGIPASNTCLNCHRTVTANSGAPASSVAPELQKLYDHLALDEKRQPDPKRTPKAIPWVKVHNLPDHACFDHRAHVAAGVACQRCHGPVETMERVRQVESLSMGWCVNCHREVNQTGVAGKKVRASTDCSACHQ